MGAELKCIPPDSVTADGWMGLLEESWSLLYGHLVYSFTQVLLLPAVSAQATNCASMFRK